MEKIIQTNVYNEAGNLLSTKLFKTQSSNGKGWSIMYNDKILNLASQCTSAATLRIFMVLAAGQQYDERGMITTKKAIQDRLHIDKKTCLDGFKWLKQNFIINEYKHPNGYTEYMVNPEYVTIGKDKKKRMKEWIRRWSLQTVMTLPANQAPIAGIVEPEDKPALKKKTRRVVTTD